MKIHKLNTHLSNIKTWFALHYNNILTCVTTAINLLHLNTIVIIFYVESGIARL
jgi:hypothetical protein